MPKRICPNGHVYDPSIYGDKCPMCPQGADSAPAMGTQIGAMPNSGPATQFGGGQPMAFDGHTHIANPVGGGFAQPMQPNFGGMMGNDASGATKVRPKDAEPVQPNGGGGHTVIRRPGASGAAQAATDRKLVGFLVTYNRNPMGKAYNIYEGRNYIGRDKSCDICISDDSQMSGRHMSILYRNVDNKFKFRDEQSSNGTFINKELKDDGELENYDIIRVGSTLFIFIAIPKIG